MLIKMANAFKNPLRWLLVAIPLVIWAEIQGWGNYWIFGLSALGLIPLAGLLGEATEALASHTGPRVGGLLNATLGNAAELIITLVAIRSGLLELVKASITGSILGNLLFVMGLALLVGGLRHGVQTFDRRQASNYAILLLMAVVALLIPSLFSHLIGPETSLEVEWLSLGVAGVMMVLYMAGLIYSLRSPTTPMVVGDVHLKETAPQWGVRTAVGILVVATLGVVGLSELLVSVVEAVVESLGVSEFFIGIILIPVIGNVAEHLVAVNVAARNRMDLSLEIAVSSSLQIALFVAPLLVFISLMMGNPLTLIFNPFELIALAAAILIAALVAMDGESNWLEGATLLAVYLILGLAFFLLPMGV
ncbi:calcium/proton exchanger [Thermanaerothrix daxensis]|nr:calcium/proton exchanger [Thermanaerothrix daxensis]